MPTTLGLRSVLLHTLLALSWCPLLAQAGQLVPTSLGHPDAAVLSLREMTVDVGVARGYARIQVRQVFENHTTIVQEGTYRFALPPSAAVGDFAIWDGLERIPGVILEKRRARSIYNELTRQRIDPGLLQQGEEEDREPGAAGARPSGSALFSVTVAPIPPLATKRLELQFNQDVPYLAGLGEVRLALKPLSGEALLARHLTVRVRLEDGQFEAVAAGLPLQATAEGAAFTGSDVRLDRDLVFRLRPRQGPALKLTAFRNVAGALPDSVALAPWERPADLPPEKDGFFLLEVQAPGGAAGAPKPAEAKGPATATAILFDTSLSQRWGGLELAYGHLLRLLQSLRPADQFVLLPYDRTPEAEARLGPASPQALEAALTRLRNRPLSPGSELARAVAAARVALNGRGRILILTSGQGAKNSKALALAAGGVPLFTVVTLGEAGEALRNASVQLLAPTATELEAETFFRRLLAPDGADAPRARPGVAGPAPFTVTGGEPRLRDIYPVLAQPLSPGGLSAWVGRYGVPVERVRFEFASPLLPGGRQTLDAALPDQALEARDLPRRWARARVDDLLARIEAEGERRAWVEEVIALSKRYKFVTPYTAFLAAPRSLLRPRRIQPGDPVLRVECDDRTVAATALFPFGLKLDLVRRPASNVWEGRFLAPEGFKDGRYAVRILIKDVSGARSSETKHFILDGKAPELLVELPASARAGEAVTLAVRTDEDVVFLTARLGDAPPVPLRWDPATGRSTGLLRLPEGLAGPQELFFEAVDGAKNRGFARAILEVKP